MYLEVMFLCVIVTTGAKFDELGWPRKLRSQVSIYNVDITQCYPVVN